MKTCRLAIFLSQSWLFSAGVAEVHIKIHETMIKVRPCVWMSTSANPALFHIFIRQFWNVTFNKIVCQLVLFLFYETPPADLLSSLLLVLLAGYFGFQVSARQLSAESGAERASKRRTNCGLSNKILWVTEKNKITNFFLKKRTSWRK